MGGSSVDLSKERVRKIPGGPDGPEVPGQPGGPKWPGGHSKPPTERLR